MSNELPEENNEPNESDPELRFPAQPADQSLEAAVHWLESEALTPEQRASIARGTEDIAAKLEVFKSMLGVHRATRLASNIAWMRRVLDNLDSDASQDRMATDAYFNLSVGQFLRALQEDDTKFILSLQKDPTSITEARKKAVVSDDPVRDQELVDALNKMAPHNRERMRKFIQALEKPSSPVDSDG